MPSLPGSWVSSRALVHGPRSPSCCSGAIPSGFLPGRKTKQNAPRLHVGLHDLQKGPGFRGPRRKAQAWALNNGGQSRAARHGEHPVPARSPSPPRNFSPRCHERQQRVGEGGRAPQLRRPHPRGRKLDVRPRGAPGHCSATRQARPPGPRRPAFRCNPFPALSLKTLWGEERKIRLPRRCKRQPSRKQKNQQNRLSSSTEGQQQHFPSS